MTREQKAQEVAALKQLLEGAKTFYVADSSQLTVEQVNQLRRKCFDSGVRMRVAKNTLLRIALEDRKDEVAELLDALKGPTAVFLSENASAPAKVMKEFRKGSDKPVLKAAYIDSAIYVGDEHLEALAALKSKGELIGDIIALLQSPIKSVIAGLQASGGKLAGILKTLSERNENAQS
jgi:large subunit ribosomal protein L10